MSFVATALLVLSLGQSGDVTAYDYPMRPLPRGEVVLPAPDGGTLSVKVEIAATPPARTRGLMWRSELPEGEGMLFIFPEPEELSFWMRNTLIPLDMLFIDDSMKVVGIVENAVPKSLVSRRVPGISRFVLEVPGGWTKKHKVKAGMTVKMTGTSMLRVQ